MNLGEAIYIGDSISINEDNSVTFKDISVTQIQVFEAVSILSKQLAFLQNKCGCFDCNDFHSLTHRTESARRDSKKFADIQFGVD